MVPITDNKERNVEQFAALCALIWFVFIMDACFTWSFPWKIRNLIGALFVFFATFTLGQKGSIVLSSQRKSLFLALSVLLVYVMLSTGNFIYPFTKYAPLLCLILWSRRVVMVFYKYFKMFILFYAILSIVTEILFITGLLRYIPYVLMEPQGNVQDINSTMNNVYLYIVNVPTSQLLLPFYRTMGPLREAGHFSIFIGFVYFIEMAVFGRRNWWFIICGLMTLSPNFALFFLIAEGYVMLSSRDLRKQIIWMSLILVLVYVFFMLIPRSFQDNVIHIVYERSLDASISNTKNEGVQAIFNGRVNDVGKLMYRQFQEKASLEEMLFGYHFMNDYILSDYRYLILHYGYLGLLLYFIFTCKVSFLRKDKLFGLSVFILAFAVFLQRAWMFEQAYVWTMTYLAVNAKFCNKICEKSCIIC